MCALLASHLLILFLELKTRCYCPWSSYGGNQLVRAECKINGKILDTGNIGLFYISGTFK